ncbi:hypothetical protein M3J09_002451 [Ascochyta lentis]
MLSTQLTPDVCPAYYAQSSRRHPSTLGLCRRSCCYGQVSSNKPLMHCPKTRGPLWPSASILGSCTSVRMIATRRLFNRRKMRMMGTLSSVRRSRILIANTPSRVIQTTTKTNVVTEKMVMTERTVVTEKTFVTKEKKTATRKQK